MMHGFFYLLTVPRNTPTQAHVMTDANMPMKTLVWTLGTNSTSPNRGGVSRSHQETRDFTVGQTVTHTFCTPVENTIASTKQQ